VLIHASNLLFIFKSFFSFPNLQINNYIMQNAMKLPFYAKASLLSVGIVAFVAILYVAQDIIVPLIFGTIIAVLLHPVVAFFERKKVNRIIAISIALLLAIILIAALAVLIFSQLSRFSESWPALVEKFTSLFNQTIHWAPGYFDISPDKINSWLSDTKDQIINSSSVVIGQTILSVGNTVVVLFCNSRVYFLDFILSTASARFYLQSIQQRQAKPGGRNSYTNQRGHSTLSDRTIH